MARRITLAFERFDRAELRFCRYLNRSTDSTAVRRLFRAVSWLDIEVSTEWDGRPTLLLHGRAAARAAELGVVRALLTLTHSDAVAGAVVVLEGGDQGAPPLPDSSAD